MDLTTPFDQRLEHVPYGWRGPIVDIVDTFETVQMGMKALGVNNPHIVLEVVKLVLERHDKASIAPVEP